jgi:hypothetical protein
MSRVRSTALAVAEQSLSPSAVVALSARRFDELASLVKVSVLASSHIKTPVLPCFRMILSPVCV